MNNDIVPLCLYNGYIGLPNKVYENGKVVYKCDKDLDVDFISQFYVVNPDFRPIPTGMALFCIKNSHNSTISIRPIYDPFDISEQCLRFITWTEPVPYTTPLFIYTYGDNTIISITDTPPSPEYERVEPIYVLFHPNVKNIIRISSFNKNFFNTDDFGEPAFRFSGYQGRCIPDPNGLTLGECVVLHNKNIISPELEHKESTLLNYLEYKYGREKERNPFVNVPLILVVILILLLLISIAIVVNNFYNK